MATTSSASTVDASKVLNLKTKDSEILSMIKKTYGQDGNSEDRALLQQLLQDRSNNASLLSNMYKTLAETTRSIIQNIRS
jgi:dephospho-CoA kinase